MFLVNHINYKKFNNEDIVHLATLIIGIIMAVVWFDVVISKGLKVYNGSVDKAKCICFAVPKDVRIYSLLKLLKK